MSFRQPLVYGQGAGPKSDGCNGQGEPATPSAPLPKSAAMQDIKSAGSAVLTSAGLTAFKESLSTAQQQFDTVQSELLSARALERVDVDRWRSWADGWLMRRIMKQRFAELQAKAEESQARRKELEEQLELSRLETQFELPDGVAKAYARLCDDFQACSKSQRIWDNVAHRTTNRIAERTAASRIVDLKPVKFSTGQCGVIQAPMPAPCLQNANGGDLYFYPGFVIYHASATNYALIEFADIELEVVRVRFHERDELPSDAVQVGTTWDKTNKDGTPDRRFKDNVEIPVMEYAQLNLKSAAGLNEEYLLSNVGAAEAFAQSWIELLKAAKAGE